jgi:Uncharacterized protein conserved in bacteria
MQFLISAIDDTTGSATQDEMAAIDAFNAQLVADGHWVFACGLADPSEAVVIDDRDGAATSTDGPLHDSQEYVSGFWIVAAPDLATARSLAAEGSRCCNRRVELRPLLGG